MNLSLNINIGSAPSNPTSYLLVAIYDPSAPSVVLAFFSLPQPYTLNENFNVTFPGLNAQNYNLTIWENITNTVGGTARNQWSVQPTQETTQVRADLYLEADVSPNLVSGTTSYVADGPNDLTGWTYSVERVAAGTQFPVIGSTIAFDANGFHLTQAGDVFNPNEKWVLHFVPLVQQAAPPPTPTSGLFASVIIVTANQILDNSYSRQGILIQGTGAALTITLPLLSTMADLQPIYFISDGGEHINATLLVQGTDRIEWTGSQLARIVLAQGEHCWLFKSNLIWNVMSASGSIMDAGSIIYSYKLAGGTNPYVKNTVLANGQTLSRITYARLFDFLNSVPGDGIVSDSHWGDSVSVNGVTYFPNKGKWTFGDGSTTFRVPYLVNQFIRGVDGSTRLLASYQPDGVGVFNASMVGNEITKGGNSNQIITIGNVNDGVIGPATATNVLVTGDGGDTHPLNIGLFALIRI